MRGTYPGGRPTADSRVTGNIIDCKSPPQVAFRPSRYLNTMILSRKHRLLHALLIAVLSSALLEAASGTTWLQRIEWISFDWRMQHLGAHRPAPENIALVLVDDASLQYMDRLVGRRERESGHGRACACCSKPASPCR